MRSTSIPKPPPLETLLFDADIDVRAEWLLRAARFRTQNVQRLKTIDYSQDVAIVRWARPRGYIVVCRDRHKDRATKLAWNAEIALHGGQVIEVSSSDLTPHTVAGLILARRSEWRKWFDEHQHGVVKVNLGGGMRTLDQQKLWKGVPNVIALDESMDDQVTRPHKRKPLPRRRRPRKKSSLQPPLSPVRRDG